jgi:hypothetical protein
MKSSFFNPVKRYLQTANQWLRQTPERALDQAYDAALMIKAIEDEHFNGGKILSNATNYSDNTFAYFQSELGKYLKIAEVRLTEFKASRFIVESTDSAKMALSSQPLSSQRTDPNNGFGRRERATLILEKLKFIDEILDRYNLEHSNRSTSLVPVSPAQTRNLVGQVDLASDDQRSRDYYSPDYASVDDDGVLDKTGVLPRSILGTVGRIKRELDPKSEEQVVQNFRTAKAKTLISIRFLLFLIIIPLLTQQVSKALIVGPIVDRVWNPDKTEIFINFELEEEALRELRTFEERLRFDRLLGRETEMSEQQIDQQLKTKVEELAIDYSKQSQNAIKNVFADLLSLIAFAIVILTNRQEIAVLKSFIDETIYGLSDSAKAFIIILFTDMFVGFHSPHGWEVLLEGFAKHLGLPANRDFIFLFIATFPVILDTIFKYWIFRYLNRISPSAVATYRSMNE